MINLQYHLCVSFLCMAGRLQAIVRIGRALLSSILICVLKIDVHGSYGHVTRALSLNLSSFGCNRQASLTRRRRSSYTTNSNRRQTMTLRGLGLILLLLHPLETSQPYGHLLQGTISIPILLPIPSLYAPYETHNSPTSDPILKWFLASGVDAYEGHTSAGQLEDYHHGFPSTLPL